MKLSILLFVLAAIICGCQCAPNPEPGEDFDRGMQTFRENLKKNLETMHKQLEKERQERDEARRERQAEQEEARRQRQAEQEEARRQRQAEREERHEKRRLEQEKRQEDRERRLRERMANGSSNGGSSWSSVSVNQYTRNGVRIYKSTVDKFNSNTTVERTVTEYFAATDKTEIRKCQYDSSVTSSCAEQVVETYDGYPKDTFNFHAL